MNIPMNFLIIILKSLYDINMLFKPMTLSYAHTNARVYALMHRYFFLKFHKHKDIHRYNRRM